MEPRRRRGFGSGRCRSRARHRYDHGRWLLPRRQISPAARTTRKGLFSRRRHGLFQGRSVAVRRHQTDPQRPGARARRAVGGRREPSRRRQRVDGPAPQFPARRAQSALDGQKRVRGPLRLQPVSFCARRARVRDRAVQGRHRQLRCERHLDRDTRLSAVYPRLPPRVRDGAAEHLAPQPARAVFLRPLSRESRGDRDRRARPSGARARGDRRLSLRRHRLPRRHGRGVLAERRRNRRSADALSQLALDGCHVARQRDSRERARRRQRRRHPFRRSSDRRRLVRRKRPPRACDSRWNHRGLLLRAQRRAGARRRLRHEAADERRRDASRHHQAGCSRSREPHRGGRSRAGTARRRDF